MNVYKPIKILYMISSLANEGPTRILLHMVRNIDRQTFLPYVATFGPEKDHSLMSQFRELGVPIIEFSSPEFDSSLGMGGRIRKLYKVSRDGDFQIAHAHCPRSLLYLAALRFSNLRSFYTLHIYPENQYKVIHGPLKGRVITALTNYALRFISKPVACSDSVAYEYQTKKGWSFSAVNNGIEPMMIPRALDRAAALDRLGLSGERKYLLFVGRLSAEKRIVELVNSFISIDYPGVDLVVVGAGPEEPNLRSLSSSRVHIMGFHADILPFLAGCDFYISPSSTEGLANTLLEAMSVGMPSIVSDIPSHRFVIERCSGFVGKLFDPTSRESLFEAIAYMLAHDTAPARAIVRENFHRLFHAQVMTQGYETLYKEILA